MFDYSRQETTTTQQNQTDVIHQRFSWFAAEENSQIDNGLAILDALVENDFQALFGLEIDSSKLQQAQFSN